MSKIDEAREWYKSNCCELVGEVKTYEDFMKPEIYKTIIKALDLIDEVEETIDVIQKTHILLKTGECYISSKCMDRLEQTIQKIKELKQ